MLQVIACVSERKPLEGEAASEESRVGSRLVDLRT